MVILDTNVISELLRAQPEPRVEAWVGAQGAADLYLTTISEAELRYGVAILPAGRRRAALTAAVDAIVREDFQARVLPFDGRAAVAYARIAASRRAAGRPISHFDAQIAAIAQAKHATLATRNSTDFEGCGIEFFNPWEQ